MAVRSATRATRTYVEPAAFGWGVAVAAVLRHSTLAWREPLDAVPLAQLPPRHDFPRTLDENPQDLQRLGLDRDLDAALSQLSGGEVHLEAAKARSESGSK